MDRRRETIIQWLEILSHTPLERSYNHGPFGSIQVKAVDYPEGVDLEDWITLLFYLAPDGYIVIRGGCYFDEALSIWVGLWGYEEAD